MGFRPRTCQFLRSAVRQAMMSKPTAVRAQIVVRRHS